MVTRPSEIFNPLYQPLPYHAQYYELRYDPRPSREPLSLAGGPRHERPRPEETRRYSAPDPTGPLPSRRPPPRRLPRQRMVYEGYPTEQKYRMFHPTDQDWTTLTSEKFKKTPDGQLDTHGEYVHKTRPTPHEYSKHGLIIYDDNELWLDPYNLEQNGVYRQSFFAPNWIPNEKTPVPSNPSSPIPSVAEYQPLWPSWKEPGKDLLPLPLQPLPRRRRRKKPSTYLEMALVVLFLCNCVFGLMAVNYACKY